MTAKALRKDALDAARKVEQATRGRWVLLTVARLPFVSEAVLEQMAGVERGSLGRVVAELLGLGLLGTLSPALTAGHNPRLFHLTDLGLAALALLEGTEPGPLAKRMGISRAHLVRLVPSLPALLDAYELLGAIAGSSSGPFSLIRWEQPWRRRYIRPTNKAPVWVRLPAFAQIAWDDVDPEYLLVPDRGQLPIRAYRSQLGHLVALRAVNAGKLPALVIATSEGRRAHAWRAALEEVVTSRGEAPLISRIATWSDLSGSLERLNCSAVSTGTPVRDGSAFLPPRPPQLEARPDGRRLPQIVGPITETGTPGMHREEQLAQISLALQPSDRELLDFIGRHPFLSTSQLASVFHRPARQLRFKRKRLNELRLVRLIKPEDVPQDDTREEERLSADDVRGRELVELTDLGLRIVAAQWGWTAGIVKKHNTLVGGGSAAKSPARSSLLRHLRHTVEANETAVHLLVAALRWSQRKGCDNPNAIWRSAAACARGSLRPDGYMMISAGAESFGCFFEYDRGTESARDYRRKFAAYYRYADTGRFSRDYDGFPTILMVTNSPGSEERIAEAACSVSVGQAATLPLLLTMTGLIKGEEGPFDPIWRGPGSPTRRPWPLHCVEAQLLGATRRSGRMHDQAWSPGRSGASTEPIYRGGIW